jgi:hypothetical protein
MQIEEFVDDDISLSNMTGNEKWRQLAPFYFWSSTNELTMQIVASFVAVVIALTIIFTLLLEPLFQLLVSYFFFVLLLPIPEK